MALVLAAFSSTTRPAHAQQLAFTNGVQTLSFNNVALEQAVTTLGLAAGREVALASRWCAGFVVSQTVKAGDLRAGLNQLLGGLHYELQIDPQRVQIHVRKPDISSVDRARAAQLELLQVDGPPGTPATKLFRPAAPHAAPPTQVFPATQPYPMHASTNASAPAIAPGVALPKTWPRGGPSPSGTNTPATRPSIRPGMPISELPFLMP